jgi:methylated-DNA-[protein]-cysteine S-methyltransferase
MVLASDGFALCGAWFAGQKYFPLLEEDAARKGEEDGLLRKAAAELDRYFKGEAADFSVPLRPAGTAFQKEVWSGIAEIGYGRTASYKDLAALLGSSPRAVGSAVGRNPLSVFIPCHRVVGSGGALTGYAGGLDRKKALLALEASGAGTLPQPPDAP